MAPATTAAAADEVPSALDAADTALPRVRRDPIHLLYVALIAVGAGAVLVRSVLGPIRDIDSYWHILVGQAVLGGAPVPGIGADWTLSPVDGASWTSTQVLAEVVFAWLYNLAGLPGLILFRAITTLAIVVSLVTATFWRRPLRAAAWPTALTLVMVGITSQERPQQVTYALAPLVGWWAMRLFTEGRLPRWWVVIPLVVVWANVHGGWILLPALLVLAGLARLLDHGLADRPARWAGVVAAGCLAAAALSPAGLANITAARRIGAAAWGITEWQPVEVWSWLSVPLCLLLLTLVIAWARASTRPSRGEMLLVLAVFVFSFSAWRNITPGMLVLAPIVVVPIARWLGDPAPDRSRLGRAGVAAIAAATVLLASVMGAVALRQDTDNPTQIPPALVQYIADTADPQRVLNTYNVGGAVLLAGTPPRVRVAIDGRADLYGWDYIERYMTDLVHARGTWQSMFAQLAPTCALLRDDEELGDVLVDQRGWVKVAEEGHFVLLRAPDAPGW